MTRFITMVAYGSMLIVKGLECAACNVFHGCPEVLACRKTETNDRVTVTFAITLFGFS